MSPINLNTGLMAVKPSTAFCDTEATCCRQSISSRMKELVTLHLNFPDLVRTAYFLHISDGRVHNVNS